MRSKPLRSSRGPVAVAATMLTLAACVGSDEPAAPSLTQAEQALSATLSIGVPSTPVPTANANTLLTYQLDFAIAEETATGVVLRVSMDDINGLHTPGVDDGLASDCERDYGLGVGGPMKCVAFSSAIAALGATPVKSTPADTTRGAVTWSMGTVAPGLYSTSIVLSAARHMTPGSTIQIRATLTWTGPGGASSVATISAPITVGTQGAIAPTPTSTTAVGVGGTINLSSKAVGTYEHDLEGFRRVVTLSPGSTCAPVIETIGITDTGLPTTANRAVVTAPPIGAPIGTGADRVEYTAGRMSLFAATATPVLRLTVPATCADGTIASFTQIDTYDEGTPAEVSVTSLRHFAISTVVCGNLPPAPQAGFGKEFHGLRDVNRHTTTDTTGAPVSYRAGDVLGFRASTSAVTVGLDDRWTLYTVPSGMAYTGFTADALPAGQAYKDCDGSGLLPTDPAFDVGDPTASGWSPTDEGYDALGPYTPDGTEADPRGEAGPGCRILARTGPMSIAQSSGAHNVIVLRGCANTEACAVADGTSATFPMRVFARYDAASPAVRECGAGNSPTFIRRLVAEPVPELSVSSATSGAGTAASVAAGESMLLYVMSRNAARASTFPAGAVYGVDLGAIRDQVALAGVVGVVSGIGAPAPPLLGQNVVGQTCDAAAMAQIKFQPPDPGTCTGAGAAGCFAHFYDIPDACQPANGNLTATPRLVIGVPIARGTAAGTVFSLASQARAADRTTVLGTSAGLRTVAVLPQPTIAVEQSAPTSAVALTRFAVAVRAENLGNTPVPGIYMVTAMPTAGVGLSTATPTYGKVYVDVPASAGTPRVETATAATCATTPLTTTWTDLAVSPSVERAGYGHATDAVVDVGTRCVRVRLGPGSPGLPVAGALRYAVDLTPGAVADGIRYDHQSGVGASATLLGTVNYAFTAATPALTTISSDVQVAVSKRVALGDAPSGGTSAWILTYRNHTPLPLTDVEITDQLPTNATFAGLVGALPPGVTCVSIAAGQCSDEPGPGGRQVRFRVASLAANDGAIGDGDDEGEIALRTTAASDVAGTLITNCGQATGASPSLVLTPSGCTTVAVPELTLTKTMISAPATVVAGDILTYQIVATNPAGAPNTYVTIRDALPAATSLVPGSIRIDGAVASDALVSAGVLTYERPAPLGPGTSTTLQLQVQVAAGVGAVSNTAVAVACGNPIDPRTCGVPRASTASVPRPPQDFDGDGLLDTADEDPVDPFVCRDVDADGCDDCAVTGPDGSGGAIANDGLDTDTDGACNLGDTDDDDDGVLDGADEAPLDQTACGDADADACDDCAISGPLGGGATPGNDGLDTDNDGACNGGDSDDDDDGVLDGADEAPLDQARCTDGDSDGCDDCALSGPLGGGATPGNDGLDTDSDGACNVGDPDDDGDGVPDGTDEAPLDQGACGDGDADACDDCALSGPLGGGATPANDGLDTDADGACDAGDPDDDGDGVPDGTDEAPLDQGACGDADADACDDCALSGPLGGGATPADDGNDFDADGLCDQGDLDDDDDSILDLDEPGDDDGDTDGDGQPDAVDLDSDDDGILDLDEAGDDDPLTPPVDTDGDDLPDALDLDSDDDLALDADEAGDADPLTPPADTDEDDVPDVRDLDSDGDALVDRDEVGDDDLFTAPVDTDGDGTPDLRDLDSDDDGVLDDVDNCVLVINAAQTDSNTDGIGDACQDDADGDGIANAVDVCPTIADPAQLDSDNDAAGDACDADDDGDSVADLDETDPAPGAPAWDTDLDGRPDALDLDSDGDGIPDSAEAGDADLGTAPIDSDDDSTPDVRDLDSDGDGIPDSAEAGDADLATPPIDSDGDDIPDYLDTDSDNDGVLDGDDRCVLVADPAQADSDGDGVGDACDASPLPDTDGDTVPDGIDVCPTVADPAQLDSDGDGVGDACESVVDDDLDDDGIPDAIDNCPLTANEPQADLDGDGQGDRCDPDANGDDLYDDGLRIGGGGCRTSRGTGGGALLAAMLAIGLVRPRRRRR